MNYTNEQLANCFELWREYIDPFGAIEFEDFIALSFEDRILLITETFPD
jgi:hypothetical protein